ncbi:hypothetical protein RSal33209_1247 [Renibacterium salmoninarum ATCC 33209]|uniref:Uncharacterized protein n=1 Tax=Renibacterium salmoninarum (strain ATCC 33209 / DSM 20767 / JCM 11484 / NBRC 15589 / NCIMB 2235) TaxID=288705 RepID=A9WN54_RENSM|nr:hypothetical protein RSal33209_1247 [Renibacterium salmoninarum ATCC 33209]
MPLFVIFFTILPNSTFLRHIRSFPAGTAHSFELGPATPHGTARIHLLTTRPNNFAAGNLAGNDARQALESI